MKKDRAVELDASFLADMEGMSPAHRKPTFTGKLDAELLYGWENVNHDEFVKWWRNKYGWGSPHTLLARYRKLKGAV